jgi:hypothetical protein
MRQYSSECASRLTDSARGMFLGTKLRITAGYVSCRERIASDAAASRKSVLHRYWCFSSLYANRLFSSLASVFSSMASPWVRAVQAISAEMGAELNQGRRRCSAQEGRRGFRRNGDGFGDRGKTAAILPKARIQMCPSRLFVALERPFRIPVRAGMAPERARWTGGSARP